ncbi:hypothetical protein HMPREF0454_02272 [Hafnia alvei ATCC 51873]|uniref:Uncharacterized protein n=1 Tax=Hafnia alvei ATCC 51873 TaxID=1002364 RepID=G9Y6Y1_HAFAL|nr:hypothetical protein HMPREF0454_02272 [Hafnia alvei ATCC 51873]
MIHPAIAKALGAIFNCANTIGFVGMGFKFMMLDMRPIHFNAGQMGKVLKLGAISVVNKLGRNAVHRRISGRNRDNHD